MRKHDPSEKNIKERCPNFFLWPCLYHLFHQHKTRETFELKPYSNKDSRSNLKLIRLNQPIIGLAECQRLTFPRQFYFCRCCHYRHIVQMNIERDSLRGRIMVPFKIKILSKLC